MFLLRRTIIAKYKFPFRMVRLIIKAVEIKSVICIEQTLACFDFDIKHTVRSEGLDNLCV